MSREKYHQFPPNVRSFIVVLSGFIFWTNLRQNSQEIQSRYKDKVWEALFLLLYTRFWAMNNAWYFSETEWNVFGWLLLETVLSNCYKCLWTQGFVSFFCISIYNSLKLISPLIVLLLSIFMKVVTITLTFILTFFASYLLVISFVFFIENIDSLLKTALKKNWYLSSKNVGKWDCSDKWNTDRDVLLWLRSTEDRLHCCVFFPVSLVSLVGNIFIGVIV